MIPLLYILVISVAVLGLISRLLPAQLKGLVSKREYAAATMLPILAVLSPNYLIFALLVLAFMSVVPASNQERLRLFIFCLPLLPSMSWIIKAPAPINQLIRIDYNLLLTVGCFSTLMAFRRASSRTPFRGWDILMLGFFAAFLLAGAKGSSFTNILRISLELSLYTLLPYLLFSRGTAAVEVRSHVFLPLIFAAVIIAAVTIFESQRHWLLYDEMKQRLGVANDISSYAKQRGGYLRASTTFHESTSLSLFLALATVMLVALRRCIERWPAFIFVLLMLTLGQIFTFARVGLFATGVGLVAVLWFERRYLALLVAAAFAPIGWMSLTTAASHIPVLAASLGLTADASGSVDYRDLLAQRMLQEISRNPLIGMSSAEIQVRMADMIQGEGIIDFVNTPLTVTLQSGIIGLILFLLPSLILLVCLLYRRERGQSDTAMASTAVFAALLALHAGLLTTSLLARNLLWMIMLLGTGVGLCVRRRSREANSSLTLSAAKLIPPRTITA